MTDHSRLLMEYSAEEDTSLTISVLSLNISAEYHGQMIYCQIAHQSWQREATISASLNVLCKLLCILESELSLNAFFLIFKILN